jgi:hypothetical protein
MPSLLNQEQCSNGYIRTCWMLSPNRRSAPTPPFRQGRLERDQFELATRTRLAEVRFATTGRRFRGGSSCCRTKLQGSLVAASTPLEQPEDAEGEDAEGREPFISARANLPFSIAEIRSLRRIADTIAFTCGIARFISVPFGICVGHFSETVFLYAPYDGRVIWCIS